jgi:hypothetical protein
MIKINSYKSIDGVSFGCSEADAVSKFGLPISKSTNRENELELNFHGFILRFDANSKLLRECTLLPGCDSMINNHNVSWDMKFLQWVASEDVNLKEILGYLVSLRLGIALTGFHDRDESQKAIHAFREGDWDMFRERMRPYALC